MRCYFASELRARHPAEQIGHMAAFLTCSTVLTRLPGLIVVSLVLVLLLAGILGLVLGVEDLVH